MKNNRTRRTLLSLAATWGLLASSGCAQAPAPDSLASAKPLNNHAHAVMPAASAPASAPASPPAASSAPYRGVFTSGCVPLADGLFYADVLQLTPDGPAKVAARYMKIFFTESSCVASSMLVKLKLPQASWALAGATPINGKLADKVVVTLEAGLIEGEIINKDKVSQTAEAFVMSIGAKNDKVPVQKQAEGAIDKELRLIDGSKLLSSDPESPKSHDGFPTTLLLDDFLVKQ